MATRQFSEFNLTLAKRVVNIFCRVNVGAAGAVTLQKWGYGGLVSNATRSYAAAPTTGVGYATGNGEGVRSVTKNAGAGSWTITLSDSYQRLVGINAVFTSSAGTPAAPFLGILSTSNVQTFTAIGNGGVINLLWQASAGGGGLDPASGEIIDFEFTFADATEI